jgi:hypothetical protein
MAINALGKKNYKPLVSILKSTAAKGPKNCAVNL